MGIPRPLAFAACLVLLPSLALSAQDAEPVAAAPVAAAMMLPEIHARIVPEGP